MDAAEATTAAAAVEHARALASLAAMHDARLDAARLQTDGQLAALLNAFASCVWCTIPSCTPQIDPRIAATALRVQSVKDVLLHQATIVL